MESYMKRFATILAAAALGTAALAQPGYGSGWMGGGQGPGMMGGYGGMGPGIMGGGYGRMGPGMGGGYGGGMGMGPGMAGDGSLPADLSPEQRGRISEARQDFRKKQWALMQQMDGIMWNAEAPDTTFDEQAARRNFDAMAALRKQMFENSLELRKREDAVLTPQQRDELRKRGAR
jgi:Spy/CpxP family protein refolding chaperone